MASTRELKARIESVREIQKITNAMHLISTTKLRRAKAELEAARPYFETLKKETARIFQAVPREENPYIEKKAPREGAVRACLLVTSDKGMAGAYNKNAVRAAQHLMAERPDSCLFAVGQYGVNYFERQGIRVREAFAHVSNSSAAELSRKISHTLVAGFESGDFNEVYIVYTDMVNSLQVDVRSERILPFAPPRADAEPVYFEFHPSVLQVLRGIVRSYTSGFVYGALVDSFCSEQNARMTAMDTATQNAQDLLDELTLQRNRLRQAIITQEITEISAGAKALQKAAGKEGT